MSIPKHRPGAYMPRILAVLAETHRPLTRKQIAEAIGALPESISTAMLELTRTGQVEKTCRERGFSATYRIAAERPQRAQTRKWESVSLFPWSPTAEVTLPREPWADTVPAERMGAGQDARKPRERGISHGEAKGGNCNVTTGGRP